MVPLLILALLAAVGLALKRRPVPVLWREDEYRAVLDALEDGILVFDPARRPVYLNRAASVWLGFETGENLSAEALSRHFSPWSEWVALLERGGRANLQIGARYIEAVAQHIAVNGTPHTALVLHDVTAARALLAQERRKRKQLAVFDEIHQTIGTLTDPDALANQLLTRLKTLFPSAAVAISAWNENKKQLEVRACYGAGLQTRGVRPSDDPLVARLVRARQPILVEDAVEEAGEEEIAASRAYVGVPLVAGAKFVGALELFSDQAHAFSPETCETLRIIGIQAGVAIENARLYRESLNRAGQVDILTTLSSILTASLNPDELLDGVVYTVVQAVGCDRVAIYVMDNERGVLNLARARGLSEAFVRQSQGLRPALGGRAQVVLDRYPIIVSDVRESPAPTEWVDLAEQEGFRAYADFPLRGREHVLGALTVFYDQPHTFGDSELEFLRTFANQLTLALENARLYERTDRALARRVDQLAAIEEIGRELTSTLDMRRVFNLVLERAMGMTGASAGLLAVSDPVSGTLELIAQRGYPTDTLERYRATGWPLDHGIVGRVARTGTPALVNDVRIDTDYLMHLPDTLAQLVVPIVKEGRTLGVISLESSRSQGFSADDERFTTQLTELAAIAIDNARLFQQVSEARDNLQAILDSTRDGVIAFGRDRRILLANPMIERMSGISARQLVGRHVNEVIEDHGSQIATLLNCPLSQLDQAVEELTSMSGEVTRRTFEVPGTTSHFIEQTTSPVLDREGKVVGRLVVFRDITEERRLSQMRQDLTDMIIHDLRSPLTAVVGGVQFASDMMKSSGEREVIMHALEMADQSCTRLMSLVDSLLDISRLESGQMPLERMPTALPRLAQSVIEQMTPLAEREDVTLQLQVVSDVPPVDADAELISRVLVNLVDNALKHSPRNGAVTIKIIAHDGTEGREGALEHVVRCTVLDMGPGIPVENRQRVFERFAQLDGRRRGKGLGLTFCKLAVQAHGGQIWVDDNPRGRGSAFSFTLPVASQVFVDRPQPSMDEQV